MTRLWTVYVAHVNAQFEYLFDTSLEPEEIGVLTAAVVLLPAAFGVVFWISHRRRSETIRPPLVRPPLVHPPT